MLTNYEHKWMVYLEKESITFYRFHIALVVVYLFIFQYGVDMDFSSGESDVDSEEEVEKAKRAAKAEKNKKETKTLADLPDTEDLVVPAIEDLDSMSLEQITELREKIRQKVEKAQEEEKITEAKKMEQDDDYEYVWAEADPEEEQLKKVDEIVTNIKQEDAPKKKKEESSEEEEEESSDDSESDEEMNEAQLRLRAKALALAKAKVMAARKAKEEAEKKKAEEEEARKQRLKEIEDEEEQDSDVSVDRDEAKAEAGDGKTGDNEETALVPMETEEKDAPEFEYATGVANNEMYQRRSPTPPPVSHLPDLGRQPDVRGALTKDYENFRALICMSKFNIKRAVM